MLLIKIQKVISYYNSVFKYNIIDDDTDLNEDEYYFSCYISYDTESSDDEEGEQSD